MECKQVKKTSVAKPNLRLKEERELRGWSQKYVADEIGADRYYLSRWEHGTASPSPYYRQKLCAVFGKNARELGLLANEAGKETPQESLQVEQVNEENIFAQQAGRSAPIYDPTLPPPLSRTARLIGRDDVFHQLKQQLCAGNGVVLTAVNGLPGVGKTSLAVELAHDDEILAYFEDGVLWAGLGPAPDVFAILNHWGTLLGLTAQHAARLKSIEDWSRMLHSMIGQRRLLLVIDDAWRIEAALAFKIGGPHCAYLVTTRFPNIALHFTSGAGEATVLHELSTEDGLVLLTRLAPEVVKNEPEGARALVRAVGGLPLALTLMGKYLRAQQHGAQPRRIRTALERLQTAGERLHLTEPLSLLERPPGLAPSMPLSLQTVISLSDRQLEEQEQLALRALSVFPPKPANFSEEAAIAVSNVPVETLDVLSDAGLLESSGPGRYTLHQTIADYARIHLLDSSVYTRLADYYAEFVTQHARDLDVLDHEVNNIFAALEAAYTRGHYASYITCVNAFFHFLFTRGIYVEETMRHIEQAITIARQLRDDSALANALVHQGKTAYKLGKYALAEQSLLEGRDVAARLENITLLCDALITLGNVARWYISSDQAESYLQEALELARQVGDPDLTSNALSYLGSVMSDKGYYAEAEAYTLEALELARSVKNSDRTAHILTNLCAIALLRGDFEQGDFYGRQALELARQIGYYDLVSVVLTNLGSAALDDAKDYVKAEAYFIEALDLARRTNDSKVTSANLASLGDLAKRQGKLDKAAAYLQEALEIARPVGDIWLLSTVLNECGELYLIQGRLEEAFAVFNEAVANSAKGNREPAAAALYGLARVASARGNIDEARQKGQESLTIYESMGGHRLTETVKTWLNSL
jgi:tetratricopeptide (TPR) repeat protein/transcriptional regulator with XRE-family HTH domain